MRLAIPLFVKAAIVSYLFYSVKAYLRLGQGHAVFRMRLRNLAGELAPDVVHGNLEQVRDKLRIVQWTRISSKHHTSTHLGQS